MFIFCISYCENKEALEEAGIEGDGPTIETEAYKNKRCINFNRQIKVIQKKR